RAGVPRGDANLRRMYDGLQSVHAALLRVMREDSLPTAPGEPSAIAAAEGADFSLSSPGSKEKVDGAEISALRARSRSMVERSNPGTSLEATSATALVTPLPRVFRPQRALPAEAVRPTRAEVNLDSLRHNLRVMQRVAGSAAVWAVLKDRKSTRLNSSHVKSSYAVFCLI